MIAVIMRPLVDKTPRWALTGDCRDDYRQLGRQRLRVERRLTA